MTVEKPRKQQIEELATALGENFVVVAALIGRIATKLDVPDMVLVQRLTELVASLKLERAGTRKEPR